MPEEIVNTIVEGDLTVSIWRVKGEDGRRKYFADLSRLYTDAEGNEHKTVTLRRDDLPIAARLMLKARDWIASNY